MTIGFTLNDTDGTTPYEAASYMICKVLYDIQDPLETLKHYFIY